MSASTPLPASSTSRPTSAPSPAHLAATPTAATMARRVRRVSDDEKEQGNSGWAEANTISLQKVYGNEFNTGQGCSLLAPTRHDHRFGLWYGQHRRQCALPVRSTLRKTCLTMAVVKDGALAEANAGIMQVSWDNAIFFERWFQLVLASVQLSGNGNMGVNAAAGVGNIQSNSLTIATSSRTIVELSSNLGRGPSPGPLPPFYRIFVHSGSRSCHDHARAP